MKNDRDDDLYRLLQEKSISVPDSLKPENVRKRLEALDEETLAQYSQTQRHIPHFTSYGMGIGKKIAVCGTAIAACAILAISFHTGHTGTKSGQPVRTAEDVQPYDYTATVQTTQPAKSNQTNNYAIAYSNLKQTYEQASYEFGIKDKGIDYLTYDAESSSSLNESAGADSSADTSKKGNYSDTNIRTLGVEEGDIVKTDGRCIYVYREINNKVIIYLANDGKPKKASEISVEKNLYNGNIYIHNGKLIVTGGLTAPSTKKIKELYRKEGQDFEQFNQKSWGYSWENFDCCVGETTVDRDESRNYYITYTLTHVYDVSNPKKPASVHEFFQDGNISDSRMVGEILYLFSTRTINADNIKKNDITSYIPQVGGECVTDSGVAVQKKNSSFRYNVMASIDVNKCSYVDKEAVLGGSDLLYISNNNIYIIDTYTDVYDENHQKLDNRNPKHWKKIAYYLDRSAIIKLSYQNGVIKKEAEGSIRGSILNDYCINENDGILCAVSTYSTTNGTPQNALTVLDADLKTTGKLTKIAKGEEIYSARFIGNTAYFVTYRNTDPLFAVDISNPSSPKMLGYLKIPGFSRYLHPYSDTLLLGIGEETTTDDSFIGIKLSMFDISDPANIKEVDKKVLPEYTDCDAEYNPNALFIDLEKNLFGFAAQSYYNGDDRNDYLVFSYDKKKGFVKKMSESILKKDKYDNYAQCRGLYIDDTFYLVAVENSITTFHLDNFEKITRLKAEH